MRVLIAAGGTGGHVFPATAVAERLLSRGDELNWIGRPDSLEASEARRLGIPFVGIPLRGLKRKLSPSNLAALLLFLRGRSEACRTVAAFRPHVVFALGSYVSAPVVSAAVSRSAPVILHEQNAVAGLVVRFFARKVNVVALTQPLAKPLDANCRLVGLPLRPRIRLEWSEFFYSEFGLDPSRKTLFVFGGSQGALKLCEAALVMAEAWTKDRPDWQILLQTGRKNFDLIRERVRAKNLVPVDHLTEMGKAYACADVIVARAGAVSCAEIAAVGKPAVLVPYPFASADHQTMNARAHLERFPGELLPEASLTPRSLSDAVDRVQCLAPRPLDPEERERPVTALIDLIAEFAKGGATDGARAQSAGS